MWFKRKEKAKSSLLDFTPEDTDSIQQANTDKNQNYIKELNERHRSSKDVKTFADLEQAKDIYKDPGLNAFVELWGSNSINNKRFFVLAAIGLAGGIGAGLYAVQVASQKEVVPLLVEYNGNTGEWRKPVVVENITPTDAMVKFSVAQWTEYVFTVDPKLSLNYLRNADAMTSGRAKGQFAEFRSKTEVMKNINDGRKLVFAEAKSVDILQRGVAIVNVFTRELDPAGNLIIERQYRVRVDYTLNPPKDSSIVMKNPIGLKIEVFTYDEVN